MRIANLVIPEVLIGECFNMCFAHTITYTDLRRCAGFFFALAWTPAAFPPFSRVPFNH